MTELTWLDVARASWYTCSGIDVVNEVLQSVMLMIVVAIAFRFWISTNDKED